MDAALDSLPGNDKCNWMNISDDILSMLKKEELISLLQELITKRGQGEHDDFYNQLGRVCGLDRAAELIMKAAEKTKARAGRKR